MEGKILTVTGTAQNGKGGALVRSANNETYYINGTEAWDDQVLGKQLEVTGTLHIEVNTEELQNEKGEWKAGASGEQFILVDAKWKLE